MRLYAYSFSVGKAQRLIRLTRTHAEGAPRLGRMESAKGNSVAISRLVRVKEQIHYPRRQTSFAPTAGNAPDLERLWFIANLLQEFGNERRVTWNFPRRLRPRPHTYLLWESATDMQNLAVSCRKVGKAKPPLPHRFRGKGRLAVFYVNPLEKTIQLGRLAKLDGEGGARVVRGKLPGVRDATLDRLGQFLRVRYLG